MNTSNVLGSRSVYWFALAMVAVFLIAPLWTVEILPWDDFSGHIARVYILQAYDQTPIFQEYYDVPHTLLPNLAIDLVGPWLMNWFDAYTTAKVFGSLTIVLFILGCHALGTQIHGTPTWLAIPASFFFYNALVLRGFINYGAGLAVFMIATACWLRFVKFPSPILGLIAGVAAYATYVSHLAGFVFLCAFVGLWTMVEMYQRRSIAIRYWLLMLPLLPGLLTYISLGKERGDVGVIKWATAIEKVRYAWALFSGYAAWVDITMFVGLLTVVVLVLRFGKISMDRHILVIAAALTLAFLVFPSEFHTGSDADTRFLPAAALTVTLGLSLQMRPRMFLLAYGLLLAIFAVRVGSMGWYWQEADRISVEQRDLMRKGEANSRIFSLVFLPDQRAQWKTRQHLLHLAGYATIDHNSIAGSTFAVPGQHSIQRRLPMWFRSTHQGLTLEEFDWSQILTDYTEVWSYGAPPLFTDYLDKHSRLIAQAGEGRLYQIRSVEALR